MDAELKIEPNEIWINVMPGGGPARIQPRDVHFTLIVTNPSRTDYHVNHPNSDVYRFWVMQNGSQIWHSQMENVPVIMRVEIPAGQSAEGHQAWHINDARKLEVGQYVVFGEFIPTKLQAQGMITVDEAH